MKMLTLQMIQHSFIYSKNVFFRIRKKQLKSSALNITMTNANDVTQPASNVNASISQVHLRMYVWTRIQQKPVKLSISIHAKKKTH